MKIELPQGEVFLRSFGGDKATDEKILVPYHYLQQVPGQRSRSKLAVAFNYWLDVPEGKLNSINEIIDILYNYVLLFDDLQDDSQLRRGILVAHKVYGVPATLTAATYAQCIALEKSIHLGHPKAVRVCVEQLLRISRSNGVDCYWRDNFVCPNEKEYGEACDMATAYFTMIVELMKLFSKNGRDYSKLLSIIGLYYQIRNDYMNLWSEQYMSQNKSYCEDITEGKFSFPIIHAINTSPKGKEILNILKLRTNDVDLKKRFMSLLEECGSMEYTKKKLETLRKEASAEIKKLGGNPLLEKYMDNISVF